MIVQYNEVCGGMGGDQKRSICPRPGGGSQDRVDEGHMSWVLSDDVCAGKTVCAEGPSNRWIQVQRYQGVEQPDRSW